MANITRELQEIQYSSFPEIFKRFNELSRQYGNLPADNIISAFAKINGADMYSRNNPYIQNRRVKQISSLPVNYTKDQVGEMITAPDGNEQPLRQVEHALEYSAYPLFHTRKVYQDMLTYHSYISPQFADAEAVKSDAFWREWGLLEKLRREFDVKAAAHQLAGQAIQEGKVFYYARYSVDKVHNKINHAFMQQLPSDWVKIVGFNNRSKYTVAFNMFYFMNPGTEPAQFGDLFAPYMNEFAQLVTEPPKGTGKTVIFASKRPGIDMEKFHRMQAAGELTGDPEVYYQNGNWYFWVTLPITKVFTFEIDDANRTVVSPLTGLFISMIQLAQYEQVQLELVQNPLISLVTGEIPYRDDKEATSPDPYKLSNAGRKLFEALWYQMMAENNTSGIGLYMAPLENMKLHQLAEAPSAMEISSNGYGYTMAKAGLAGIIPTTDDPKAGISQVSLKIESQYAQNIYKCMERMMKCIISDLNLKYDWRFVMFGNIATDTETEENARKGMECGMLAETLIYNALHDRSLLDDICISEAVMASGVMDKRMPLITSYSAKNDESLPPEVKKDLNPGGRPDSGGAATSEGREKDIDSYGAEN